MTTLVALIEQEREAFQILSQERMTELRLLSQALEDRPKPAPLTEMRNRHEVDMALLHTKYRNGLTGPVAGVAPIAEQVAILHASPLFDAGWYLETYRDVTQAGTDPATHYATVGAFEGRNPSATFDSMAYYMANRDVARAGWPALVHYIQFGQQAGRSLA